MGKVEPLNFLYHLASVQRLTFNEINSIFDKLYKTFVSELKVIEPQLEEAEELTALIGNDN